MLFFTENCGWCNKPLDESAVVLSKRSVTRKFCSEAHRDAYERNVKLVFSDDPLFVPGEPVACIMCKWEGELKDCKPEYVNTDARSWRSLAGREGYTYSCPKCGFQVKANYTKMS